MSVLYCVKIVVNAHRVIYVFVIYIPPSSFEILETFFELLSTTDYVYNDNVVIMGDFNVPNYTGCPKNGGLTTYYRIQDV
jgi:hypothetical protein